MLASISTSIRKHLDRYLAEFDFRQNTRAKLGINDEQRADFAIKGMVGKRLTYGTTKAPWKPKAALQLELPLKRKSRRK